MSWCHHYRPPFVKSSVYSFFISRRWLKKSVYIHFLRVSLRMPSLFLRKYRVFTALYKLCTCKKIYEQRYSITGVIFLYLYVILLINSKMWCILIFWDMTSFGYQMVEYCVLYMMLLITHTNFRKMSFVGFFKICIKSGKFQFSKYPSKVNKLRWSLKIPDARFSRNFAGILEIDYITLK